MTLEELYKDLHSGPELAFAEYRTADSAAEWLAGAGYTVITLHCRHTLNWPATGDQYVVRAWPGQALGISSMPGRTAPVAGAAPGDGTGVCGMVQVPVSGSQAASVSAVRMVSLGGFTAGLLW
jgi:metal-dependent amidase/aminoacylase/carboxypeptidase family protein